MNPDGHVIPIVDDDQGEGFKDPLTIDDLIRMGFITYREGQRVFHKGKFEQSVNDRRTQQRLINNKIDKCFHRRKM